MVVITIFLCYMNVTEGPDLAKTDVVAMFRKVPKVD